MIFLSSIDSLIFDLDGTLWDASTSTAIGWARVAKEKGTQVAITPAAIRTVAGLPFDQCVEVLFPQQSHQLTNLKLELDQAEKDELLKGGGVLYPGVADWIPKLSQSYRLFLVSNCQEWYLKAFLNYSNLGSYFSDSICFGKTGLSKAKNIQNIVLKNSAKKPLYFGDTHWDQQAAFYAGIKFVFASYGFGSINTKRCPTVNSFNQLAGMLMTPQKEPPQIRIRELESNDFEMAQKFYLSVDYVQPLDPQSRFYGAFHNKEMIGLVRLSLESNTWVLRGMQVQANYQFLGVGTRLIRALEPAFRNEDCYCLPHGWLEKFYGQIGFETLCSNKEAPEFLQVRLAEYRKKGLDIILMKRRAG